MRTAPGHGDAVIILTCWRARGSLGEVSTAPGHATPAQLWPVGYEARWDVPGVAYIFSEIMAGGDAGPFFTVTLDAEAQDLPPKVCGCRR